MSDQLTLFAGDTHASPLVLPGSAKARQMTVTSGRKCIGSWMSSCPLGSLEKTLLVTSAWASTMCFLTWKPLTTPQGRLLFRLVPSTPDIDVIDAGLWPTPHGFSQDGKSNGPSGNELGRAVNQSFPTPTSSEGTGAQPNTGRTGGRSLREAIMYPTMDAGAAKGRGQKSADNRHRLGGSLNPTWVEWLMGFPTGWTDLKHSETP